MVAIIGTMIAFIGINMSRDTDRLARLESTRFLAVVNEVRDEAILTGESYLLTVDDQAMHYGFQAVRGGTPDDGLLRTRRVENGVELDWEVFDQFDGDSDDPSVLISPLGEITPFDAWFQGEQNRYHVFVNDENQLAKKVDAARAF